MRCALALALVPVLVGCSSSAPPPPAPEAPTASSGAGPAPGPDGRRWVAGDLHLHAAPIDRGDGAAGLPALVRAATVARLDFVVLTPHLHPSTWRDPARRRRWIAEWRATAAAARAVRGLTVIPGTEYTVHGYGHFGVWGADLAAVTAADFLAGARAAGAAVVVNHPFAEPTHIPGVRLSDYDLSFRPWTDARGPVPPLDGVEAWNLPLALANLVARPGGATGEERALAAADQLARTRHQPVAIVGGTDSHRAYTTAATWVLVADVTEQAIVAALRMGATCIGGPEAGDLIARGDRDPADRWARIGEQVAAAGTVELRWQGRARLFVDGVDVGEHDAGYVDRQAAGTHTYRLVRGASRCGFVYANLTG